ncbi:ATP-binding protein [Streptomyces sp. M19]
MQMEVRPDPAEVGRARRWARSRLAVSGIGADEPLAEVLILIISELVTNAVVHTGCPAVLRMQFPGREAPAARGASGTGAAGTGTGGADDRGVDRGDFPETVRVEVTDTSNRPPRQLRGRRGHQRARAGTGRRPGRPVGLAARGRGQAHLVRGRPRRLRRYGPRRAAVGGRRRPLIHQVS